MSITPTPNGIGGGKKRLTIGEQIDALLAAAPPEIACSKCGAVHEAEYYIKVYPKMNNRVDLRKWCLDCNAEKHETIRRNKQAGGAARKVRQRLAKPQLPLTPRKVRIAALPNNFSKEDWQRALTYFEHRCAVCGCKPSPRRWWGWWGNDRRMHKDHWIPITYTGADNPGTVPGNIVPLCHSCNCSKSDKMPEKWLKGRYSGAETAEIMLKVERYFAFVRSRESSYLRTFSA